MRTNVSEFAPTVDKNKAGLKHLRTKVGLALSVRAGLRDGEEGEQYTFLTVRHSQRDLDNTAQFFQYPNMILEKQRWWWLTLNNFCQCLHSALRWKKDGRNGNIRCFKIVTGQRPRSTSENQAQAVIVGVKRNLNLWSYTESPKKTFSKILWEKFIRQKWEV